MSVSASSVVRGSLVISLSKIITNALGFLSTVILARLLVPEDFGLVALAAGILAIVNSFTSMPVSTALVQREDIADDFYNSAWTIGVIRSVLVALVMAVAAWPIASLYQDMRLFPVLLLMAGGVFFSGAANPKMVVFVRNMSFWQDAINNVVAKLVSLVAVVALALLWRSYWALVIGGIVSQFVSLILSYAWLPYRPSFTLSRARELIGFSWWMTCSDVVNTVNWKMDPLILGGLTSRANLGLYTVGGDLAALPTREAMAPLTQSLFAALSRIKNDLERSRRAVSAGQALIFFVALPVGLGFSYLADPLVRIVLGEKWSGAVFVVQALSILYALQTLAAVANPLALAHGKTRELFLRDVILMLIRVPPVVVGLLLGGINGAVMGRVFAGLLHLIYNLHFVRQICGLTVFSQLRGTVRTLFSGGAMWLSLIGVSHLMPIRVGISGDYLALAVHVVLGALVFGACHLMLWASAGFPEGPEQRVIALLAGVSRRFSGRHA